MKKIWILAIAVLMLGLAACSSSEVKENEGASKNIIINLGIQRGILFTIAGLSQRKTYGLIICI